MTIEQFQSAKVLMDKIFAAKNNLDRLRKAQYSKAAITLQDYNGSISQYASEEAWTILETAIGVESEALRKFESDLSLI